MCDDFGLDDYPELDDEYVKSERKEVERKCPFCDKNLIETVYFEGQRDYSVGCDNCPFEYLEVEAWCNFTVRGDSPLEKFNISCQEYSWSEDSNKVQWRCTIRTSDGDSIPLESKYSLEYFLSLGKENLFQKIQTLITFQ